MSGAGCTWIQILHPTRSAELPFQLTLPALAKACPTNWPWRGPFRGGAELPQKLQQKLLQKLDGKNDRTICHWNHLRMFFCPGRMAKLIQSNIHYFVSLHWWSNSFHAHQHTTRSQINHVFLFHGFIKILTACRMLKISIARCQIKPEIHSFPTMYIMEGG